MSESRHITISIGRNFEAGFLCDSRIVGNIALAQTERGFQDWKRELTYVLTRAVHAMLREIPDEPEAAMERENVIRAEFEELAHRGAMALRSILGEEGINLLRSLTDSFSQVTLEISSHLYGFPWELLYDDDPDEFQYRYFWGFKYVVYHNISPSGSRLVPKLDIETSSVRIGLLADRELLHVESVEVPFFEHMSGTQLLEPGIQLEQLTRHDRHRAVKNELKHFFQQEMNIIHFACHTRAPIQGSRDPTNEQFCLLLSKSNDLALWISDLYMTRLGNHPLVVLNACGTTPREVDATWNMVNAFLQNGACGVVTTECEVPDALAAAFTLQFYPLLLAGHELGAALFETRHKLLRHPNHNPLGLLYAMYAHPKTRIVNVD